MSTIVGLWMSWCIMVSDTPSLKELYFLRARLVPCHGRVGFIRLRRCSSYLIQVYAPLVSEVYTFLSNKIIVFLQVKNVFWLMCARHIMSNLEWSSSLIWVSYWYGITFGFVNVSGIAGVHYPVRVIGYEWASVLLWLGVSRNKIGFSAFPITWKQKTIRGRRYCPNCRLRFNIWLSGRELLVVGKVYGPGKSRHAESLWRLCTLPLSSVLTRGAAGAEVCEVLHVNGSSYLAPILSFNIRVVLRSVSHGA